MAELVSVEKLFKEIKDIKEDVSFIKTHMFHSDAIMTPEEGNRFDQAMKNFREGKTTPIAALKKDLGI